MSYKNRSAPLLVLLTCLAAIGGASGLPLLWPAKPAIDQEDGPKTVWIDDIEKELPPLTDEELAEVLEQARKQKEEKEREEKKKQPTPFIETVAAVQPDGSLYFGYKPDPVKTKAFVATLPAPNITVASPGLFAAREGDGPKKDFFGYRALLQVHREIYGRDWVVAKQGIGDCVSHAWAHALSFSTAIDYQNGETSQWLLVATEPIYGGSRVEARGGRMGGYSDGSYGGAAAKWVHEWGVIHRKKYDLVDLTTYSSDRAKDWGNFGCGGRDDNGRLDAIAKEFPVGDVTLVRSFDEAAAAIHSGYIVAVCSQQGFTSRRSADAFAEASGTWAHAMCFHSVRYDPPGLLCQNSWGPDWISGPKYPDDMPDGSFWVRKNVVDRMLAGQDSFAVSRIKGFPFRPLDHSDWAELPPPKQRERDAEPVYALAP